MLLILIIIVQNNKFSIIFLKYFNQNNFDIKNIKNVEVLSSMSVYISRFEHVYWANLMKMCVKKTKSCLIKFISLYNDFECLIRYLI